ncbi:immunoreactivesantigen, partial [human gut metagenome]
LLKAGDSAEANNARGCLASMKEDYQTAKQYFEKAIAGGLKEAQENLDKVNQAL